MNPCGCQSFSTYDPIKRSSACGACGAIWGGSLAALATPCQHKMRKHDQFGTTCMTCGADVSDPAWPTYKRREDYCKVCGNRMEEISLFTSKVKHCRFCERAKEANEEVTKVVDDDPFNIDLDDLFKKI